MTHTVTFSRETDESLIIVDAKINDSILHLAFDTGATHTVIDLTALLVAGINLPKVKETSLFETASGVLEAQILDVPIISFANIQRSNFTLTTYDYLANGILSDIDGVLGLDFLQGYKFCVDTVNHELSFTKIE
jgi:predicted aspartyl protease